MGTIIAALSVPFLIALFALIYHAGLRVRGQTEEQPEHSEPFVISEYYSRIEQAALDILESRNPVDQTIILWWGLDGLKLTEDGELEWVSRKKPKLVNQNVSYQPCQSIAPMPQYTMCQSPQAQIGTLMAQNTLLQLQAAQNAQNSAIIGMIQTPLVYPPYLYQSQLTQCCCNWQQNR